MKLSEAARVIRSKNAGPLTVTVDLMVGDGQRYRQVARMRRDFSHAFTWEVSLIQVC